MAENLVINGVTYPAVDVIEAPNESGASVQYKVKNRKSYKITHPTAVASQDVTVVSGDADVAEHYADADAVVIVRKVSNLSLKGTTFIYGTNKVGAAGVYGYYANYNETANAAAMVLTPLTVATENVPVSYSSVRCNANGDIIVHAHRLQNNFGGADYEIEFLW